MLVLADEDQRAREMVKSQGCNRGLKGLEADSVKGRKVWFMI